MMTLRYRKAIIKCADYLVKRFIRRKPVIAYVGGWLGKNNLGDEALYMAMQKIFYKYNFIHFDDSKTITYLLDKFPFVKAGILAGGTLINKEAWCDIGEHFYKVCPNIYIFGTGVANPSFWEGRSSHGNMMNKWKPLLDKCKYIGVRGPMSADLIVSHGIYNVEVIGDPVITFADDKISSSYHHNSIGLNLGQSNGNVWGDENIICHEYAKLASLAKLANWEVKWFVVWPDDLEITKKAANYSNTSSNIYEIYCDPHKYMDMVRPLSIFVGMKLHATILATCAYVPSIMLEYRPKCKDYMKSIGQDDATIRTDQFAAEDLWKLLNEWNIQRIEKSKLLFNCINMLKIKQDIKAKKLMDEIASKAS
jgi:polysaccharide pyruvyl transferase WcaK-like protein